MVRNEGQDCGGGSALCLFGGFHLRSLPLIMSSKIDLPPLVREELETRFHSIPRRRDPDVFKEVKRAVAKSGASDLSEEAVAFIRDEIQDSVNVIEKDKYLSADPFTKYHKDALMYALKNVLTASLLASISAMLSPRKK